MEFLLLLMLAGQRSSDDKTEPMTDKDWSALHARLAPLALNFPKWLASITLLSLAISELGPQQYRSYAHIIFGYLAIICVVTTGSIILKVLFKK